MSGTRTSVMVFYISLDDNIQKYDVEYVMCYTLQFNDSY